MRTQREAKIYAANTIVGKLRRRWNLPDDLAAQCIQKRVLIPGIRTDEIADEAKGFKVNFLDPVEACRQAKSILVLDRHHPEFGNFILIKVFRG